MLNLTSVMDEVCEGMNDWAVVSEVRVGEIWRFSKLY